MPSPYCNGQPSTCRSWSVDFIAGFFIFQPQALPLGPVPHELISRDDYDWSLPDLELPEEFYRCRGGSNHGDTPAEMLACVVKKKTGHQPVVRINTKFLDFFRFLSSGGFFYCTPTGVKAAQKLCFTRRLSTHTQRPIDKETLQFRLTFSFYCQDPNWESSQGFLTPRLWDPWSRGSEIPDPEALRSLTPRLRDPSSGGSEIHRPEAQRSLIRRLRDPSSGSSEIPHPEAQRSLNWRLRDPSSGGSEIPHPEAQRSLNRRLRNPSSGGLEIPGPVAQRLSTYLTIYLFIPRGAVMKYGEISGITIAILGGVHAETRATQNSFLVGFWCQMSTFAMEGNYILFAGVKKWVRKNRV